MKNDLSIENALKISNRFININWRDGPIGCVGNFDGGGSSSRGEPGQVVDPAGHE